MFFVYKNGTESYILRCELGKQEEEKDVSG